MFTLRNLERVLREKYEWSEKDAKDFSDFLEPMLDYVPENGATDEQCLQHPWLRIDASKSWLTMAVETVSSLERRWCDLSRKEAQIDEDFNGFQ